jgi:formyltetrahydrofolate deformylase
MHQLLGRNLNMPEVQTLTLSCKDRPGITARVTGYLFDRGGNVLEAQQFNAQDQGSFFMRVEFDPGAGDVATIKAGFAAVASEFGMSWDLRAKRAYRKVMLLVSKFDHCLGDLLYRTRIGELPMQVVGVIGNHPLESLNVSLIGDIPYHYLPVTKETKPDQEAQIKALVEESGTELVVLARYMQILSADLCRALSGRCINIHHSFLPSFKGAKPYHQAFERGVKIIGATAHYVTTDLDEGPIIEQGVQRVDHGDTPDDLVEIGRDVECNVLARAVLWHVERRIVVNGRKTVVFS